uniref:hypothetical protein n=1 Tax=Chitinophaga polysaccharea TaxID=1293035 RepID=UPI00163C0220|nr:hypothetical protein [Chitinophaga polysaccharea]
MEPKGKFDYEALKRKTLEQLRSGKSLFGKDGAFASLLKDILETALEGEMEAHLDDEQRANGNRKNGKNRKWLKTADDLIRNWDYFNKCVNLKIGDQINN